MKREYRLPELPYSYDALEPVISRRIMELHHRKHHNAYVKGANAALEKLEELMEDGSPGCIRETLRTFSFNLNGHLLHSLFWKVMRPPREDNAPSGELLEMIERDYGNFERFKELFTKAASSVEGVGWGIAYTDGEHIYIGYVEKHNLYHLAGFTPVLLVDVWEHAYYLQYENRRKEYLENWWKVVNWDFVEKLVRDAKTFEEIKKNL